jgi:hypothetical protein
MARPMMTESQSSPMRGSDRDGAWTRASDDADMKSLPLAGPQDREEMKLFSIDMQYAREKKDIIPVMADCRALISNSCDAASTFAARLRPAFPANRYVWPCYASPHE